MTKVDGATFLESHLQRWTQALLLASTHLTSLSVRADGITWQPVLGLIHIRHLELTMCHAKPWLDVITTDLSLCSCLESLKIADKQIHSRVQSLELPDLLLREVATLKSVELVGWYPKQRFTLPPGCVLRLAAALGTSAEWEELQAKGCPPSMLRLVCPELQAWPRGVPFMSGLQYLEPYCRSVQDQDLAALQRIPHLYLGFAEYSTFRMTSGSWRSFQIRAEGGLSIKFSSVDAFVRGTERFVLECSGGRQAEGLYGLLRAACKRQGVACHECRHLVRRGGDPDKYLVSINNKEECTAAKTRSGIVLGGGRIHELIMRRDELWPSRVAYPELYSCESS